MVTAGGAGGGAQVGEGSALLCDSHYLSVGFLLLGVQPALLWLYFSGRQEKKDCFCYCGPLFLLGPSDKGQSSTGLETVVQYL